MIQHISTLTFILTLSIFQPQHERKGSFAEVILKALRQLETGPIGFVVLTSNGFLYFIIIIIIALFHQFGNGFSVLYEERKRTKEVHLCYLTNIDDVKVSSLSLQCVLCARVNTKNN